MKKFDLKFNDEIAKKIIINPKLGRQNEVRKLLKILTLIEDNTVIAIDENWGSGKTFFLEEIKYVIQNKEFRKNFGLTDKLLHDGKEDKLFDDEKLENYVVLYYNSWQNELHKEPLESILFSLLNVLEDNKDKIVDFSEFKKSLPKNLFNIFRGLGSDSLDKLNEKIKNSTGIDTKKTIDAILNLKEDFDKINTYKDLAKNIVTTEEIKEAINDLLNSLLKEKTRIIFIVDELDRCKPDYAVNLLETINHFYNNDKITFVLGVNLKELQKTLKKFYGTDFDSYKYLHKFFDVILNLKRIDTREYISFVFKNCSGHNMMPIEERYMDSNTKSEDKMLSSLIEFIDNYSFSLRDINRSLLMYELVRPTVDGMCLLIDDDKKSMQYAML